MSQYSTAPILDYHNAAPLRRRDRLGDFYLKLVGIVLLGYAIGGKGFAYWGANPIYVGEMTLAVGLFYVIKKGGMFRTLRMTHFLPLTLLMFWGALRTFPYVSQYGFMAFRDSVLWSYGLFAYIAAALFIARPERIAKILPWYRTFSWAFLLITPVMLALTKVEFDFPVFPGGNWPFLMIKGGDVAVHMTGVFAYVSIYGATMNPWVSVISIPLCLAMCITGRAAMVTFLGGVGVFCMFKPLNWRSLRIVLVLVLGLVLLWATEFRTGSKDETRNLSFDYLTRAVTSITGGGKSTGDDMEGTKQWRMTWWTDIVNYTFNGKYFWGGKGFGINLADDDGHQLNEDSSLRSPHNGHLTVLARSGVVGLGLWAFVHLAWACTMMQNYFRARRRKDWKWSGLFLMMVAYWIGFVINASFDVFLEGPMGGVWWWNLYGFGIAAAYIFKRCPQALHIEQPLTQKQMRKMLRKQKKKNKRTQSANPWIPNPGMQPMPSMPMGTGRPQPTYR